NFHGAGPEQNASQTIVAKNATINADAITSGNGGNVAVWSNNGTKFYGAISARGGAQSGDGGFVEVSGKDYLAYRGRTDVTAHQGKTGTLLLDPDDLVIRGGTGDGDGDTSNTTFQGGATAGTISAGDATSAVYESEIEG